MGWLSLAAVAALVFSCKDIPRASQASAPKAQLIKDGELPLLMTRLGQYPKRMVTSAEKVPVRFYFDPQLVDLRRVKGYSLWSLDSGSKTWRKIGAASPDSLPLELSPDEGLHGLRASVTYDDGTEKLVPSASDLPAMWLCVDRSAPTLGWVSPNQEFVFRGKRTIDLEWDSNDVQFGDAPTRLEWSGDRGRTWKKITELPAKYGQQGYAWSVPDDVYNDILVRVVSRDLVGHQASSVLVLNYSSSAKADGPAIAMETPIREEEKPDARSPAAVSAPEKAILSSDAVSVVGASAHDAAAVAPECEDEGGRVDSPNAEPQSRRDSDVTPFPDPRTDLASEGHAVAPAAPAPMSPFRLEPFASKVIGGGSTIAIAWKFDGAPPATPVTAEWSGDGGATWSSAGEAPLEAGKLEWKAPARSAMSCLVRLQATLPGGARVEARSRDAFSIDADAPRISLGEVPAVTNAELDFAIAVSDPGGAGLARVDAFLRKAGGREWKPLDAGRVKLEGGALLLDLAGEDEAAYELSLRAVDRVGNASPVPLAADAASAESSGAAASSIVRFRLDRTPPAITARPAPLAWVAGFAAEALVDVDWTDAVPPLVIEGQSSDGTWKETGRWASVSPDQNRFSFIVPAGAAQYAVRFSAADQAGNRGYATLGPRAVEPPLRLASFTETRSCPSRGSEKVLWKLHSVAAEVAEQLRVTVDHQPRRDAAWQAVYESLPAKGECYWDLPSGDGEEHRLRIRLLKGGKVVGEDISAPFSIGGKDVVAPTVVRIKEESLFYSEQGRQEAEKHTAAFDAGGRSPAELERFSASIAASYEKALSLDANNYHATYGLAQYLNRADSEKNAASVLRWLERTVEIKPDHFWALNDLGAVHIRDGQFQKAEEALRKCAGIEASPIVLYNLGLALFYGGKMAEARERFEAALKAGRGAVAEGEIYYYLVQSYLQEGDKERAKGLFHEKEAAMPADMRAEIAKALES